jgi:hypothetical protein
MHKTRVNLDKGDKMRHYTPKVQLTLFLVVLVEFIELFPSGCRAEFELSRDSDWLYIHHRPFRTARAACRTCTGIATV